MVQTISDFIKNKNALIVEDEPAIAQLLKIQLTQLGFNVDCCFDAETALKNLQNQKYELCLLDWMLPKVQGIDFLKSIRPQNNNLKIMMVTAKADADSIVLGLESGADDYLTKPFDSKVLSARVRNLMGRLQVEQKIKNEQNLRKINFPDVFVFDELSVCFSQYSVRYQNSEIHLTNSEFKLLSELIQAQGLVLTRDQLIDSIQGEGIAVTERVIDTHIFTLRKKISGWAKHIETIRGVGYRILISVNDKSEPDLGEEVL